MSTTAIIKRALVVSELTDGNQHEGDMHLWEHSSGRTESMTQGDMGSNPIFPSTKEEPKGYK